MKQTIESFWKVAVVCLALSAIFWLGYKACGYVAYVNELERKVKQAETNIQVITDFLNRAVQAQQAPPAK